MWGAGGPIQTHIQAYDRSGEGGGADREGPRLTAKNLRTVDPCVVLGKLPLQRYGTPRRSPETGSNMSECDQWLSSANKKTIRSVNVRLGEPLMSMFNPFKSRLAGLSDSELNNGMCSESVFTDSDAHLGFALEYDDQDSKRNCVPARALARSLVKVMRGDPPKFSRQGILALVDPCDTVHGGTLNQVLRSSPHSQPGAHDCAWGSSAIIDSR